MLFTLEEKRIREGSFEQFVSLTLELPIVNRKLFLPKPVKMTGP